MTTTAPGARTAAVPARRRRPRLVFGGGVIVTMGAAVSTVNDRVAEPTLSAPSVAFTSKVC